MNRKTLLKAVVTLVFLAIAVTQVRLDSVVTAISSMQLKWFVLAGALNVAGVLLSTRIWQEIVRADEYQIPYSALLIYYYLTQFFSTFLPSTVGGDGARAYYLSKDNPAFDRSFASIATERLIGLTTLCWVAAIALIFLPTQPTPVPNAALSIGILSCNIGGLGLIYAVGKSDRVNNLISLTPIAGELIAETFTAISSYANSPGELGRAVIWSLMFRGSSLLVGIVLGHAVGLDIAMIYYLAILPVIEIAIALPISIQGIGVREVAFVHLFGAVGGNASAALALAITLYASNIVFNSGTGAAVYLAYRSSILDSVVRNSS